MLNQTFTMGLPQQHCGACGFSAEQLLQPLVTSISQPQIASAQR
jgi:hypothetical protein